MTDQVDLLAVFPDLEPAADAIQQLRTLGVHDHGMHVISGVPVTEAMLGPQPNGPMFPVWQWEARSSDLFWQCFSLM